MRKAARAASVAAAFLLASACRPAPIEETRSLNFDPETTGASLVAGWDVFERTESGDTYVWARAKEARLSVSSRADGDRLVRFRCWPFAYPGAPLQSVEVSLNGRPIGVFPLANEPRVYAVTAPKGAWTRGANELRFVFAYAGAPKDAPGAADTRPLAAAFDWLEILPASPRSP